MTIKAINVLSLLDGYMCIECHWKIERGILVLYFSAAASATTPIFRLHLNRCEQLTQVF